MRSRATCGDVRADVLYVPHHGAYEPVLGEFVRAVKPDHAVISGKRPEPAEHEKVRRLFTGTWLYETYRDGTIHLRATQGGWRARLSR